MRETHDDLAASLARAGLPEPLVLPAGTDDLQADPFAPLLQVTAAGRGTEAPGRLRERLLARVARSAGASRAMQTRRHADTAAVQAAHGVTLRPLYRAQPDTTRRPGEPDAVTLVELAPGATWRGPQADAQREWLVLRGGLRIGGVPLQVHDYHVAPAGLPAAHWSTGGGALLYQRQSRPATGAPARALTQRAEGAEWADYAPGIKRRLMWQQGGQAAMLYHALPGAAVPHHAHEHDEECLMLAGDFFLDEVLLRTLDYQIAPAGSEHHISSTDTGVLIYAHGDVSLALK